METRTGFFFRGRGVLAHLKKRPVESIVGPEIFSTFDWPGYLKQFISFLHSRCFKLLSILSYKGGLKNRKFKVRKSCCFCFPYNKKDASFTEWLQPTGDEANKRVSRSYRGSSSRSTPGHIYVITMDDCEGHSAPPFAKVGYTMIRLRSTNWRTSVWKPSRTDMSIYLLGFQQASCGTRGPRCTGRTRASRLLWWRNRMVYSHRWIRWYRWLCRNS